MALQGQDINDIVKTGLRELGRLKFTDIATALRQYVAMTSLIDKNKVGFSSGSGLQWSVKLTQSATAANVGLYAKDQKNVGDTQGVAQLDWRQTTVNWSYDEREIMMNAEPAKILDLLKVRRYDAQVALADRMETNFWSLPAAGNTVDPHGVPYWVVKNATAGFNGGAPSGYTTVAGINPSTYSGWKNYTAPYSNVTKADFVRALRTAMEKCYFRPPVQYATYNTGNQWGFYAGYDNVVRPLTELLDSQNQNLGLQLDAMGDPTFRRTGFTTVPKLETDTDNPVYGLNWGWFRPVIMSGMYMKERGPIMDPEAHNVYTTYLDLMYNFECRNRREQFVISNGTSGAV